MKINKPLNTPFSYFGIPIALIGIYFIIDDLANPSKMTPLVAYIGLGILIVGLFFIGMSLLLFVLWPDQKNLIWKIQWVILLPIMLLLLLFLINQGLIM